MKARFLPTILPLLAALAFPAGPVANGGFETLNGKNPEGWSMYPAKGEEGPVFVDNAEAHTGRQSLALRHKSVESYSSVRIKIAVKPATEYTASVWMKAEAVAPAPAGASGSARLFIEGDGGKTLAATIPEKGSFGWKRVAVTFTTGSAAELPVILYLHRASGTVWFDDLELVEGKAPAAAAVAAPARGPLPGVNLAKGKKYTMSRAPNYKLCTDPDDDKQLTDGLFTEGYYWTQKSTVGWVNAGRVEIIIDLGAVEPIRELAIGIAGGAKGAGVNFPDAIFFVSEDGKSFYHAGRRMAALLPDRGEWYATRHHLNDLRLKGRYVAVSLVANGSFMFTDEIEVIKGDFDAAAVKLAGATFDVKDLSASIFQARKAGRDIAALRRELATLGTILEQKAPALKADLAAIGKELEQPEIEPALLAALRQRAGGLNAKAAAAVHSGKKVILHGGWGWKDFGVFDIPPAAAPAPDLALVMGRGEWESASFALFNADTSECKVTVAVSDLVGKGAPIPRKNISLRYGEWVEANDMLFRPDALPLAEGAVPMIPGTSRSFWVTVKSEDGHSGAYTGTITVAAGKETFKVPITVTILPVSLPRPVPVATYNWAYLVFAPMKADPKAALADLAAHHIDTAVLHPSQMPEMKFDESGKLLSAVYTNIDEAIRLHREAGIRKFWFFSSFGDIGSGIRSPLGNFNKSPVKFVLGSPEWKVAMRAAVADWVAHCKSLGLGYEDFAFYPIDEPDDKLIHNGGKQVWDMFKEADPKARIFVDPTHATSVEAMEKIAPSVDIWCPHLDGTLDEKRLAFFAAEKKAGKSFYTYNCKGPDKTFPPLGHYRRLLWQAWQYGMTGAGHWDYADTGWTKGENSAWTDFDGGRTDFSVIYDRDSAPAHVTRTEAQIPSRRWEAWRDGVEDYSWAWLLRETAGKSKAKDAAAKAQKILDDAAKAILANPDDLAVYRGARAQILGALVDLTK
ncbi:MAG: carbohydrate binding domain-containing protein [Spirochaetes bacterium]|nr:carbohydrate binding domain-containing protein [Spirochaetota bacterium]